MKRVLLACALMALAGCNAGPRTPTAMEVVSAFQKAGLEAENSRALTKTDYGLAPMLGKDGVRFLIPSLGPDNGGRIYTFENNEDRDKVAKYYNDFGRASAALSSHVLTRDRVLVQINSDLPQERAAKYKAALDAL